MLWFCFGACLVLVWLLLLALAQGDLPRLRGA